METTKFLLDEKALPESWYSLVPDHEVTFDVAPRNMTPAVFGR